MQRMNDKPSSPSTWLEQIAVLASSLVWTGVVLLIISFFWAYQDAQARWELLQEKPDPPIPAAVLEPDTPTPTATVAPPTETPSPTPSPTPVATKTPTPTATYVLGPAGVPPEILPETPLEMERKPTPSPRATVMLKAVEVPTNTPVPPTSTPTPTPASRALPATPAPPPPATGGPTRVVIKSVGIDAPVVPVGWSVLEQNGQQYSVWDVADFAGGWHKTSALPGHAGNTVLSGHHNIKGEVFRYLVDVQEGDEVNLYVDDAVYRYYVEQKLIVKEKGEPVEVRRQNAEWIAPTNDVRLTLVTCWPYTNNTHRVIVVARPRS